MRMILLNKYIVAVSMVLLCVPIFAGGAATSDEHIYISELNYEYQGNVLIPEAFSDVFLGIDQKKLLDMKKGQLKPIAHDQPINDENHIHGLLFERVSGSKFIDNAIYFFENNNPELSGIALSSSRRMKDLVVDDNQRFKEIVIAAWGYPDEIVVEAQSGEEFVCMIWNKENISFSASFLPESIAPQYKPIYVLRFFRGDNPLRSKINIITKPKKTSLRHAIEDIKKISQSPMQSFK